MVNYPGKVTTLKEWNENDHGLDILKNLRGDFRAAHDNCNRPGWYLIRCLLRSLTPTCWYNGLVIAVTDRPLYLERLTGNIDKMTEALQAVNSDIKELRVIKDETETS